MASKNALRVAHEVSETIRQGKLVNMGKIIRKSGYTKSTSDSPQRVTNTKTYRAVAIPLIQGLQEEITEIKKAMAGKDKSREEYRVLVGSLDVLTKNYQLLSGGATERQVFVIPSEILERNALDTTQDDVKQIENGSS